MRDWRACSRLRALFLSAGLRLILLRVCSSHSMAPNCDQFRCASLFMACHCSSSIGASDTNLNSADASFFAARAPRPKPRGAGKQEAAMRAECRQPCARRCPPPAYGSGRGTRKTQTGGRSSAGALLNKSPPTYTSPPPPPGAPRQFCSTTFFRHQHLPDTHLIALGPTIISQHCATREAGEAGQQPPLRLQQRRGLGTAGAVGAANRHCWRRARRARGSAQSVWTPWDYE
jgi:hypothetical protein